MEDEQKNGQVKAALLLLQRATDGQREIFWCTYKDLFLPARHFFEGELNEPGNIGAGEALK